MAFIRPHRQAIVQPRWSLRPVCFPPRIRRPAVPLAAAWHEARSLVRRRWYRCGIKAGAVVVNIQRDGGRKESERHRGVGGGSVEFDVRRRALDHPQEGVPDIRGNGPGFARDEQPHPGDILGGGLPERLGERGCLKPRRRQFVHQAAGLGQVPPQQLAGPPQVLPGGLSRPVAVRRLEQQEAAGQPLRDGVVDLPGHPLALGDGPGPALAGGQLPLGQRNFPMQAALLRGVVLYAVVDQRQHDANGEGTQQHG